MERKMMKGKERVIYKINKTAGKRYLQVWEWNDILKRYVYIKPCGTARKLLKKLVKLEGLENQTKNNGVSLTKK